MSEHRPHWKAFDILTDKTGELQKPENILKSLFQATNHNWAQI